MKHYSFTRFQIFDNCPLAYFLTYIKKVKGTTSLALLYGRLIHKIIAEYDRHLLRNNLSTDITIIPEITKKVFFEPETEQKDFYKKGSGLSAKHFQDILDIMEVFASAHIFKPDTTVGIEEKLKLQIEPDTTLWMIIDRLEISGNEALIVDYKTDWAIRSEAEIKKDLQMLMYCWGVLQVYPQIERFKVAMEFVRHAVTVKAEHELDRVAKVGEIIEKTIEKIEGTTVFDPSPGAACTYCGHASNCPVIKNLGDLGIAGEEDALRIAQELTVLEKQVADREEALKRWCNIHGPVETGGVQWGFSPVVSRSVKDIKQFTIMLQEAGKDPYAYLSVDGRKAKKLFEQEEELLAPILEDESYTRFGSHKVKDGAVE